MKNAIEEVKKESNGKVNDIQETALQDEQEETYRIYEYLKKNPGVFAGSGAMIVAVLSALINFCSYLYERSILKYWNIDPVYINLDTASRLYGAIAAFIFVCVMFSFYLVIDMLVEKSMPVRRKVLYLKRIKREYRKEVFKKTLNKVWSWCLRKPCDKSLDDHSNNAKETIDQLEKSLKEQKKGMNKQVIRHLLLVDIVLSLSVCIWVCVEMTDSSGSILMMLLSSVLASTVLTAGMYITTRYAFVDKKKIKDEAVCQYKALTIETDVPQISFPLKKLLSGDYSIKQPDRKIKRATAGGLVLILFVVAALLVLFQVFGYQKAEGQTQFMITSAEGIEYAIIYNNGDNAIIARCMESDNALTIDSSFQKVVSIEGLEYDIRQYENVEPGPITTDEDEAKNSVGDNEG